MSFGSGIGILSIFFGTIIIGNCIIVFLEKQVLEIHLRKTEIIFRLIVDFITAGLSIAFGILVLIYGEWAVQLTVVSQSLVIYSTFTSAGFFGKKKSETRNLFPIAVLNFIAAITAAIMVGMSLLILNI